MCLCGICRNVHEAATITESNAGRTVAPERVPSGNQPATGEPVAARIGSTDSDGQSGSRLNLLASLSRLPSRMQWLPEQPSHFGNRNSTGDTQSTNGENVADIVDSSSDRILQNVRPTASASNSDRGNGNGGLNALLRSLITDQLSAVCGIEYTDFYFRMRRRREILSGHFNDIIDTSSRARSVLPQRFLTRKEFPSDQNYGTYVQNTLTIPGMRVKSLVSTSFVDIGDVGIFVQSNVGSPPVEVLWEKAQKTRWVCWHELAVLDSSIPSGTKNLWGTISSHPRSAMRNRYSNSTSNGPVAVNGPLPHGGAGGFPSLHNPGSVVGILGRVVGSSEDATVALWDFGMRASVWVFFSYLRQTWDRASTMDLVACSELLHQGLDLVRQMPTRAIADKCTSSHEWRHVIHETTLRLLESVGSSALAPVADRRTAVLLALELAAKSKTLSVMLNAALCLLNMGLAGSVHADGGILIVGGDDICRRLAEDAGDGGGVQNNVDRNTSALKHYSATGNPRYPDLGVLLDMCASNNGVGCDVMAITMLAQIAALQPSGIRPTARVLVYGVAQGSVFGGVNEHGKDTAASTRFPDLHASSAHADGESVRHGSDPLVSPDSVEDANAAAATVLRASLDAESALPAVPAAHEGKRADKVIAPSVWCHAEDLAPLQIVLGWNATFVLSHSGKLYACGSGRVLGLGCMPGEHVEQLTEVVFPEGVKITHISATNHALACTDDGYLYAWGENYKGCLGTGTLDSVSTPCRIAGVAHVVHTACGDDYSAAISRPPGGVGRVFTWGRAAYGRLGHGKADRADVMLPTAVEGLVGNAWDAVQVACGLGDAHTLVLTREGVVYSFGDEEHGKLGRPTNLVPYDQPGKVTGLDGIKIARVCCGDQFSLALSDSGRVYVFGLAKHFQLGTGVSHGTCQPSLLLLSHTDPAGHAPASDSADGREPARGDGGAPHASMDGHIVDIAAGPHHAVAVTDTGDVYTWGECWVAPSVVATDVALLRAGKPVPIPRPVRVRGVCGRGVSLVSAGHRTVVAWSPCLLSLPDRAAHGVLTSDGSCEVTEVLVSTFSLLRVHASRLPSYHVGFAAVLNLLLVHVSKIVKTSSVPRSTSPQGEQMLQRHAIAIQALKSTLLKMAISGPQTRTSAAYADGAGNGAAGDGASPTANERMSTAPSTPTPNGHTQDAANGTRVPGTPSVPLSPWDRTGAEYNPDTHADAVITIRQILLTGWKLFEFSEVERRAIRDGLVQDAIGHNDTVTVSLQTHAREMLHTHWPVLMPTLLERLHLLLLRYTDSSATSAGGRTSESDYLLGLLFASVKAAQDTLPQLFCMHCEECTDGTSGEQDVHETRTLLITLMLRIVTSLSDASLATVLAPTPGSTATGAADCVEGPVGVHCSCGDRMALSKHPYPASLWRCDGCGTVGAGLVWHCDPCREDRCAVCTPSEKVTVHHVLYYDPGYTNAITAEGHFTTKLESLYKRLGVKLHLHRHQRGNCVTYEAVCPEHRILAVMQLNQDNGIQTDRGIRVVPAASPANCFTDDATHVSEVVDVLIVCQNALLASIASGRVLSNTGNAKSLRLHEPVCSESPAAANTTAKLHHSHPSLPLLVRYVRAVCTAGAEVLDTLRARYADQKLLYAEVQDAALQSPIGVVVPQLICGLDRLICSVSEEGDVHCTDSDDAGHTVEFVARSVAAFDLQRALSSLEHLGMSVDRFNRSYNECALMDRLDLPQDTTTGGTYMGFPLVASTIAESVHPLVDEDASPDSAMACAGHATATCVTAAVPGVHLLRVVFDNRSSVGAAYDCLEVVTDNDGKVCGRYYGANSPERPWPDTVIPNGASVSFRLVARTTSPTPRKRRSSRDAVPSWGWQATVMGYGAATGRTPALRRSSASLVESPHPYPDNMNSVEEISIPGSVFLLLDFADSCRTESDYDVLSILVPGAPHGRDGTDDAWVCYCQLSGPPEAWPRVLPIPGERAQFKFTSDASGTAWGYKVHVAGYSVDELSNDRIKLSVLALLDVERSIVHVLSKYCALQTSYRMGGEHVPAAAAAAASTSGVRSMQLTAATVMKQFPSIFAKGLSTDTKRLRADDKTDVIALFIDALPKTGVYDGNTGEDSATHPVLGMMPARFLYLMYTWATKNNVVLGGGTRKNHPTTPTLTLLVATMLKHNAGAQRVVRTMIDSCGEVVEKELEDVWRAAFGAQMDIIQAHGRTGIPYEVLCNNVAEKCRFLIDDVEPTTIDTATVPPGSSSAVAMGALATRTASTARDLARTMSAPVAAMEASGGGGGGGSWEPADGDPAVRSRGACAVVRETSAPGWSPRTRLRKFSTIVLSSLSQTINTARRFKWLRVQMCNDEEIRRYDVLNHDIVAFACNNEINVEVIRGAYDARSMLAARRSKMNEAFCSFIKRITSAPNALVPSCHLMSIASWSHIKGSDVLARLDSATHTVGPDMTGKNGTVVTDAYGGCVDSSVDVAAELFALLATQSKIIKEHFANTACDESTTSIPNIQVALRLVSTVLCAITADLSLAILESLVHKSILDTCHCLACAIPDISDTSMLAVTTKDAARRALQIFCIKVAVHVNALPIRTTKVVLQHLFNTLDGAGSERVRVLQLVLTMSSAAAIQCELAVDAWVNKLIDIVGVEQPSGQILALRILIQVLPLWNHVESTSQTDMTVLLHRLLGQLSRDMRPCASAHRVSRSSVAMEIITLIRTLHRLEGAWMTAVNLLLRTRFDALPDLFDQATQLASAAAPPPTRVLADLYALSGMACGTWAGVGAPWIADDSPPLAPKTVRIGALRQPLSFDEYGTIHSGPRDALTPCGSYDPHTSVARWQVLTAHGAVRFDGVLQLHAGTHLVMTGSWTCESAQGRFILSKTRLTGPSSLTPPTRPLRWDPDCHGSNIQLSEDGMVASRVESYSEAIVVSDAPLAVINGCREYEIELREHGESSWSGSIACGITTMAPTKDCTVKGNARGYQPSWLLDGTNVYHDGVTIAAQYGNGVTSNHGTGLESLTRGGKVKVVVDREGQLRFFFNGVDQGVAATGLPVGADMWVLADVYGQAEGVAVFGNSVGSVSVVSNIESSTTVGGAVGVDLHSVQAEIFKGMGFPADYYAPTDTPANPPSTRVFNMVFTKLNEQLSSLTADPRHSHAWFNGDDNSTDSTPATPTETLTRGTPDVGTCASVDKTVAALAIVGEDDHGVRIGSTVRHPLHGKGTVVNVYVDGSVAVELTSGVRVQLDAGDAAELTVADGVLFHCELLMGAEDNRRSTYFVASLAIQKPPAHGVAGAHLRILYHSILAARHMFRDFYCAKNRMHLLPPALLHAALEMAVEASATKSRFRQAEIHHAVRHGISLVALTAAGHDDVHHNMFRLLQTHGFVFPDTQVGCLLRCKVTRMITAGVTVAADVVRELGLWQTHTDKACRVCGAPHIVGPRFTYSHRSFSARTSVDIHVCYTCFTVGFWGAGAGEVFDVYLASFDTTPSKVGSRPLTLEVDSRVQYFSDEIHTSNPNASPYAQGRVLEVHDAGVKIEWEGTHTHPGTHICVHARDDAVLFSPKMPHSGLPVTNPWVPESGCSSILSNAPTQGAATPADSRGAERELTQHDDAARQHAVVRIGIDAEGINTRINGITVTGKLASGQIVTDKDAVDEIVTSSNMGRGLEVLMSFAATKETFWESSGASGSHWIQIMFKPQVVVTSIALISFTRDSYRPSLVNVHAGTDANNLVLINENIVCSTVRKDTGEITVLDDSPRAGAVVAASKFFPQKQDRLGRGLLDPSSLFDLDSNDLHVRGPDQSLSTTLNAMSSKSIGEALHTLLRSLQIYLARDMTMTEYALGFYHQSADTDMTTLLDTQLILFRYAIGRRLGSDVLDAVGKAIRKAASSQTSVCNKLIAVCITELGMIVNEAMKAVSPNVLQSEHPYKPCTMTHGSSLVIGAACLEVTFDKLSCTASEHDVLCILDGTGTLVAELSGLSHAHWAGTYHVEGDTVQWIFKTASANPASRMKQHWGWRMYVSASKSPCALSLMSESMLLSTCARFELVQPLLKLLIHPSIHYKVLRKVACAVAECASLDAIEPAQRTWAIITLRELLLVPGVNQLNIPLLLARAHRQSSDPQSRSTSPALAEGMWLEAEDIRSTVGPRWYPAFVQSIVTRDRPNVITVAFDGTNGRDPYLYETSLASGQVHPIGWCEQQHLETHPGSLSDPSFSWSTFLSQRTSSAVPSDLFAANPPVEAAFTAPTSAAPRIGSLRVAVPRLAQAASRERLLGEALLSASNEDSNMRRSRLSQRSPANHQCLRVENPDSESSDDSDDSDDNDDHDLQNAEASPVGREDSVEISSSDDSASSCVRDTSAWVTPSVSDSSDSDDMPLADSDSDVSIAITARVDTPDVDISLVNNAAPAWLNVDSSSDTDDTDERSNREMGDLLGDEPMESDADTRGRGMDFLREGASGQWDARGNDGLEAMLRAAAHASARRQPVRPQYEPNDEGLSHVPPVALPCIVIDGDTPSTADPEVLGSISGETFLTGLTYACPLDACEKESFKPSVQDVELWLRSLGLCDGGDINVAALSRHLKESLRIVHPIEDLKRRLLLDTTAQECAYADVVRFICSQDLSILQQTHPHLTRSIVDNLHHQRADDMASGALKLAEFIESLPKRLATQYALETPLLESGDHLCHSALLKALIDLTVALGMDRLPCFTSQESHVIVHRKSDMPSVAAYTAYLVGHLQPGMFVKCLEAQSSVQVGDVGVFLTMDKDSKRGRGGKRCCEVHWIKHNRVISNVIIDTLQILSTKELLMMRNAGCPESRIIERCRLVTRCITPLTTDNAPCSAIHFARAVDAVVSCDVDGLVHILEEGNVSPDAMDAQQQSLLCYAAAYGNGAIVDCLCEAGACLQDPANAVAIHVAVYANNVCAARGLICQGIDLAIRSADGKTALDLAKEWKCGEAMEALLRTPCRFEARNSLARTVYCEGTDDWSWLRRYRNTIECGACFYEPSAKAMAIRAPFPRRYITECRVLPMVLAEERRRSVEMHPRTHESNQYFTKAMDAQIVRWFSSAPDDLVAALETTIVALNAGADSGGVKVLLATADNVDIVEHVRKVLSHGFTFRVESCPLGDLSVSLAQKYDCTVVWSRDGGATYDASRVGDVLGDIVGEGGTVVSCFHASPPLGRWASMGCNLLSTTVGDADGGPWGWKILQDERCDVPPEHANSLFQHISILRGPMLINTGHAITPPIVHWPDGSPAIMSERMGAGTVVSLNMYPPYISDDGSMHTDAAANDYSAANPDVVVGLQLLANSITYFCSTASRVSDAYCIAKDIDDSSTEDASRLSITNAELFMTENVYHLPAHQHPVADVVHSASFAAMESHAYPWMCDQCDMDFEQPSNTRYRCVQGCDYDVCHQCLQTHQRTRCVTSESLRPVVAQRNKAEVTVPGIYDSLQGVPVSVLRSRWAMMLYYAEVYLLPSLKFFDLVPPSPTQHRSTFEFLNEIREFVPSTPKEAMLRRILSVTMHRGQEEHGEVITLNRLQPGTQDVTVFEQACAALAKSKPKFWLLPSRVWKVHFAGEGMDDVGGGYSESISEMCEELHALKVRVLIQTPNGRDDVGVNRDCFLLNPESDAVSRLQLEFLGRLLGVAIRTGEPVDLRLAAPMWKLLVGQEMTVSDIVDIDQDYIPGLEWWRGPTAPDDDEAFEAFDFPCTTTSASGRTVTVLKHEQRITKANVQEYLRRALHIRLHEFDSAVAAVRSGMATVVPVPLLSLFTGPELQKIVCGDADVNIDLLKTVTVYCDGLSEKSKLVVWFWEVLTEMSSEQRSHFLRFTWGRTRMPRTKNALKGCSFQIQLLDKYVQQVLLYATPVCVVLRLVCRMVIVDTKLTYVLSFSYRQHKTAKLDWCAGIFAYINDPMWCT